MRPLVSLCPRPRPRILLALVAMALLFTSLGSRWEGRAEVHGVVPSSYRVVLRGVREGVPYEEALWATRADRWLSPDGQERTPGQWKPGDRVRMERGDTATIVSVTPDEASPAGQSPSSTRGRVVALVRHDVRRFVAITTPEGTVTTTPKHRFFVEGAGWRPAEHVHPGDLLRDPSGRTVPVERAELQTLAPHETARPVYNFTVERLHTYYVGPHPLWVHNTMTPCAETPAGSSRARSEVPSRDDALKLLEEWEGPEARRRYEGKTMASLKSAAEAARLERSALDSRRLHLFYGNKLPPVEERVPFRGTNAELRRNVQDMTQERREALATIRSSLGGPGGPKAAELEDLPLEGNPSLRTWRTVAGLYGAFLRREADVNIQQARTVLTPRVVKEQYPDITRGLDLKFANLDVYPSYIARYKERLRRGDSHEFARPVEDLCIDTYLRTLNEKMRDRLQHMSPATLASHDAKSARQLEFLEATSLQPEELAVSRHQFLSPGAEAVRLRGAWDEAHSLRRDQIEKLLTLAGSGIFPSIGSAPTKPARQGHEILSREHLSEMAYHPDRFTNDERQRMINEAVTRVAQDMAAYHRIRRDLEARPFQALIAEAKAWDEARSQALGQGPKVWRWFP